MKILIRLVFVMCILPVFALATVCGAQEPKKGTPVAAAPQPHYDFAPVPEGTEVVHDFVLQNKGKDLLVIEQVKTG
jgi:hypothetical protein